MNLYKFVRTGWRGGSLCVVLAPNEVEARRIATGYGRLLEKESGLSDGLLTKWLESSDCKRFDQSLADVVAWAEC